MNKESKQSPATAIGVRITAEEIFFTVGNEDKFKMSASSLLQILDFKARREAAAMEKEQGPEFSLERFVQVLRLLRKGLSFPQMMPIFELPISELKAGYLRAEKKFGTSENMNDEIRRQREDGEKDHVKQLPFEQFGQRMPGGEELINLPGLRADLRGSNLKRIAKERGLDYTDLKDFYEKNKKYLMHLR